MSSAEKKPTGEAVQLERVLNIVSGELRMLALASNKIQGALGDVLKNSEVELPESVYDLQNIDRLTQTIEALSTFMDHLSIQMQSDWSVDAKEAAKALTLAAVATRLSAVDDDALQENQGENITGECLYL